MYLPRSLISLLYTSLVKRYQPSSAQVLILSSLETDAICACRILTSLFKRDYIQHIIQPVAGYDDLRRAGERLVRPMKTGEGGSGGVVICLGVGGMVDLASTLGLQDEDMEDDMGGVEVWVLDARRPWHLQNVFGGLPGTLGTENGAIKKSFQPGRGGVICFDDGDIVDELSAEQEAYSALTSMPELDDDDDASPSHSDAEDEHEDDASHGSSQSRKRKSWSDGEDSEGEEDERPQQRRRSNSGSSITSARSHSPSHPQTSPSKLAEPNARLLRKQLRSLRSSKQKTLDEYYALGISYSEPISSLAYSLASELGRDDNDLLWLAVVGVTSLELSGHTSTGLGTPHSKPDLRSNQHHQSWRLNRSSRVYALLRDEVRRLNPPTTERQSLLSSKPPVTSASDSSIQLIPDPRFMLLRHWSLYESMMHSPYLAARLHVWNDSGVKRLNKLLAKMGISLQQCKQGYMHMNVTVRADLRERLLKYASMYGLEELVPTGDGHATYEQEGWGFLRTWGWKAQLSAVDVGIIVAAILETVTTSGNLSQNTDTSTQQTEAEDNDDRTDALIKKYFLAYDALAPRKPNILLNSVPKAQHLMRSIQRTGSALLAKHQIRHLRAFRMGVVKDGPDLALFANSPGALARLALWVAECVAVSEKDKKGTDSAIPFVLAALHEPKGIYVVVGTGGGIGSADDLEARKEKEQRRKKKQEERETKQKAREEKKAARRLQAELNGDSDIEDDLDTEDESEVESSDEENEEQEKSRQKRGYGRNKFGLAFQSVVEYTGAKVKVDSFDHCVVEVAKEDLAGFLEALSRNSVVGK